MQGLHLKHEAVRMFNARHPVGTQQPSSIGSNPGCGMASKWDSATLDVPP
jgi:hypothetical protein